MRAAVLLFLMLALVCPGAVAQTTAVSPGHFVQVTTPTHRRNRRVGTVLALSADTLVLHVSGEKDSLRLPWSEVSELYVSRGQRRQAAKGMRVGALVGTGLGVVMGFMDEEDFFPDWLPAVFFGGVGSLLGGLAGASSLTEKWERIPLGGVTVRMRVAPRDDALGLLVSARF